MSQVIKPVVVYKVSLFLVSQITFCKGLHRFGGCPHQILPALGSSSGTPSLGKDPAGKRFGEANHQTGCWSRGLAVCLTNLRLTSCNKVCVCVCLWWVCSPKMVGFNRFGGFAHQINGTRVSLVKNGIKNT